MAKRGEKPKKEDKKLNKTVKTAKYKDEKELKRAEKETEKKLLAARLQGEIPRILALRKMGLSQTEIAKQLGVSIGTFKRYCRDCPDLQEVCACRAYREEYVMASLFRAFCSPIREEQLSEKGKLKFLEILLKAGLLEIRKKLLELEAELKKAGSLPADMSLTVNGISDDQLSEVMHSLTRRGRRDEKDFDDRTGQSDFAERYEIVDTHTIGGNPS